MDEMIDTNTLEVMKKLVKVTGGTKYVLFRWGTKYAIVTHRCNNFAIVTNLVFLFSHIDEEYDHFFKLY